MKICGLMKLTLLDFPEKTACTIFTGGCNFRCPFCHNASLVTRVNEQEIIPESKILSFLSKRQGLLDGVCITGGEPLLQPDIEDFIRKVKDLGFLVKLDTNGSYPDKLKQLVSKGIIDYVAMDIKSSPENYGKVIGIDNFDVTPIRESAEFLMEGHIPYEFRTTLVKELHDENDIVKIGQWLNGADKFFLQTFVDSGDIIGKNLSAFSKDETEYLYTILRKYIKTAQIRGLA